MKLATWNINSLKVRLDQLLAWIRNEQPDVVCLQETKIEDASFPQKQFRDVGYHAVFAGQRGYNGVAILSHFEAAETVAGIPVFPDEQKRVVATTLGGIRIVCVYVPNGESVDSDKYQYKLTWLTALEAWLAGQLKVHPKLAVLGDYNIAPDDRDVHDPRLWEGKVLFSQPEQTAFQRLLSLGLRDSYRLFDQPERSYTWWDYRMNAFKRNLGLRIDHILLSPELARTAYACRIDKSLRGLERPSDHAAVIAELRPTG